MTTKDRKAIEEIETKLNNYKYNEIPKEFVQFIEEQFSSFAYIKSLLEMKKEVN